MCARAKGNLGVYWALGCTLERCCQALPARRYRGAHDAEQTTGRSAGRHTWGRRRKNFRKAQKSTASFMPTMRASAAAAHAAVLR